MTIIANCILKQFKDKPTLSLSSATSVILVEYNEYENKMTILSFSVLILIHWHMQRVLEMISGDRKICFRLKPTFEV